MVFALLTVLVGSYMIVGFLLKRYPLIGGLGVARIVNCQCLPTEVHCQNKAWHIYVTAGFI